MEKLLTTFPKAEEFDKAVAVFKSLGISHEVISPGRAYSKVGVPALVVEAEDVRLLSDRKRIDFIASGWVDYRPASGKIPEEEPASFKDGIFTGCAIMVLAPCVADYKKLRLIVHTASNIEDSFPYLNAEMPSGTYTHETKTFTFMDGYRMISLYGHRITLAKTDDIVDTWRLLEKIRCMVNEIWSRRSQIQPSYELRQKPPALEIYKRLPGTNCRLCGQKTCMAFAMFLWRGEAHPSQCRPIFEGEHGDLKEPLMAICAGLGISEHVDGNEYQ